ncbi:MAG: hypothetical protein WBP64_21475 [Nitrososphaeraceae archaeon]
MPRGWFVGCLYRIINYQLSTISLAAFAMNMSSEPICIMAASKGLIIPIKARTNPKPSTNNVPKKFCRITDKDCLDVLSI